MFTVIKTQHFKETIMVVRDEKKQTVKKQNHMWQNVTTFCQGPLTSEYRRQDVCSSVWVMGVLFLLAKCIKVNILLNSYIQLCLLQSGDNSFLKCVWELVWFLCWCCISQKKQSLIFQVYHWIGKDTQLERWGSDKIQTHERHKGKWHSS